MNADAARWVLRRVLLAAPVVLGVALLTFTLLHAAPGDPVYLLAGDAGDAAYYADIRAKYGLDRPFAEQLLRYGRSLLTGDLGYSFTYHAPVARVLLDHAGASLLLGATAIGLAMLLGIGGSVFLVLVPSRLAYTVLRVGGAVAYAAPVFWTGQVLMLVVSLKLGLLPVSGMSTTRASLTGLAYASDVARHLVLPGLTLALPFLAVLARVCHASLLAAVREPFALAAYARGFTRRRVVLRHALPHALVPVAALVGQHAGQIVAGAALTEVVFAWPGIGSLVLHASQHRDYPLVTAAFIVISISVVFFNAVADGVCAWLDPRIRLH